METITTGRPLDDRGNPTDGPALEIDPEGRAAELFRESPHPLASSPGTGIWSSIVAYPEPESDEPPAMLVWLAPDATELPPHVHTNDDEYFRAVEGQCTVVVEGEPRRLDPGEDRTIRPGQEHYFRNDTDGFVAFYVELPWNKTLETQFTFFGLDHEGAFGDGDGYGEPGLLYALVMGEELREGTVVTVAPRPVQRVLWATVGRVARAMGYAAIEKRFLRDEYWEATVEQPDL